MNKLLRKIITACVVLTMLIGVNMAEASADEPVITYGIEYTDNSATITLYTTIIEAFDIAVAYDPSVVSVSDCGYTTQFKELQVGGENTTISVLNDDAKDDAGNTYMVFTGAGANMESGEAIDFAGKPLAFVTFEGDLANAAVTIVTESATVSNVYEAKKVAELTLNGGSQTVITPEPVDDVVYESIGKNIDAVQGKDTNESAKDDATTQNSTSEESPDSSTVDVGNQDETNYVNDESDSEAEETEDTKDTSSEGKIAEEDEVADEGNSVNTVILGILIGVAVIIIVAIIIVVLRKKNK